MQRVFEKIREFLKEKFDYNSEQAEIWRSGDNVDAFMIGRSDDYMEKANCYGEVMRFVNQVASEYGGGWIPCSERLPEKNGWYLVTNNLGVVQQQYWCASHWGKLRDDAVVAWCELPEPYKAESEE